MSRAWLHTNDRRTARLAMNSITALALMCVLAACGASGTETAKPASTDSVSAAAPMARVTLNSAQIQHGGVQWSAVTVSTAASETELPGQLVPNEDHTTYLGAPAEGRVMRVHVRLGDRVVAGQPLVTLQSAEATAARADSDKATAGLSVARASSTFARAARERAERLLAVKAASREEVEHAQTNDDVARGAVQQAEAELVRARIAREQLGATSATGLMVLRSPLNGVVLSRDATPGAVAAAVRRSLPSPIRARCRSNCGSGSRDRWHPVGRARALQRTGVSG